MSFNYAARDYDTIKTDLLARAGRVLPEWTDRDPSDFGMLMVDLWAMMGDVMHYYADNAASESFLETATQRESVLAIASLLDYRPVGRASATGTVKVVNESLSAYIVYKDTEFVAIHNASTFTLYAKDTMTVPAQGSLNLPVGEGDLVEDEVLTDSSVGGPGQKYKLSDANAAPSTIRIDVYEDGVNAVAYYYVPSLGAASPGARVFTYNLSADGYVEVNFGNFINGLVPPIGATVTATYASCSGVLGNLPANSAVGFSVAPASPGVSLDSTTPSTATSGGMDAESITSMKTSIPSRISTQERCVTYNDFVATALTLPGVAKATMLFTQGSGTADNTATMYIQENRTDFLTTAVGPQAVDTDLRSLVESTIQSRALLGVVVDTAATITWQPIDLAATVYVNRRAVSNTVSNDVTSALNELFAFDNVKFGQLLHLGQVHRVVLNVPGVDYVDVTKFDLGGGSAIQTAIQIADLELPQKGFNGGSVPAFALTFNGGISTS